MFCNHGVRAIKLFSAPTKIPAATESAAQTRNERNKKQFPRLVQKLRKAAGGSHTHAARTYTRETGGVQQKVCVLQICAAPTMREQKAPRKN